jgi:hypothetical protein
MKEQFHEGTVHEMKAPWRFINSGPVKQIVIIFLKLSRTAPKI